MYIEIQFLSNKTRNHTFFFTGNSISTPFCGTRQIDFGNFVRNSAQNLFGFLHNQCIGIIIGIFANDSNSFTTFLGDAVNIPPIGTAKTSICFSEKL